MVFVRDINPITLQVDADEKSSGEESEGDDNDDEAEEEDDEEGSEEGEGESEVCAGSDVIVRVSTYTLHFNFPY